MTTIKDNYSVELINDIILNSRDVSQFIEIDNSEIGLYLFFNVKLNRDGTYDLNLGYNPSYKTN